MWIAYLVPEAPVNMLPSDGKIYIVYPMFFKRLCVIFLVAKFWHKKYTYRVSHELRSLFRESVPYVKIYRYNPKHLCPKLNG